MKLESRKIPSWIGIALVFAVVSGFPAVARAEWSSLTNAPPGHLDTCLQLTDGTVACHQYSSNRWHRLTPNDTGSFVDGAWSTLATMPNGTDTSTANGGCAPCTYAPLYFASAVLADGRMVVIGGEYNSNGNTWTDIGFLYNPVTNAWSAQLTNPFGTPNVGDAQTAILANGTLLLANISTTNIASFDPATLSFTALNPTSKDDINDEENWNLLPDGTLLTVDSRIASSFEIYNPLTNSWGTAGTTPVNLADTGGSDVGTSREVGPAVLRPDGTLFYTSGNPLGQNAVYNTATGTWTHTAAMDFPESSPGVRFAVADGPASILPDGHVLVQASPVTKTNPFSTPSHFFEWDGTSLTEVTAPTNANKLAAYQGRMLVLPTGQVLFTGYDQGSTDVVQVYSNGGTFQNAWRPVITAAPANVASGGTYPLSGRQLNGLSQGASYGDDAHMSTNYPLVRFTNLGTGKVCYARTHDHSSMGVATGNAIVSTSLDVPGCLGSGRSELRVVANGIPSDPVIVNGPDLVIEKTHFPAIFTQGDAADTFTITVRNDGLETTSGLVTVHDSLPLSLAAVSMSGPGWSCNLASLTCTRSDGLAAGASYPSITLIVAVASDAPLQVVNTADVSGGNQASTVNVTGNDEVSDAADVYQHTTLQYTGDLVLADGGTASMSGILLVNGDPSLPVAGQTVVFTLGTFPNEEACLGVTDPNGIARCTMSPVVQPLGPGVVSAVFAGNGLYLGSSDEDATLIFAFPSHGGFAVGDRSSAAGASATFWDAQWSAANELSGGAAPPGFKGFAASVSTLLPTCGDTWTTGSGNSSNPPSGPLPSYMGVLVPSSVTKSGPQVSGDVLAIVVVQTGSGYAPNPGHPGTGTIVAQYCHR